MQLRDYFRIIGKRIWVIVLVCVIAASSAFVISKLQTPEYRSTIYLNVMPARLDWGLQQTIKALMRNYAGAITSRDTALKTIDRLQLDITPEQMAEKLTVSPIESDFLLQIDADDYDPLLARDVVQTTAEVFVEDIKIYMLDQDKADRVEVSIRDYALPGTLHKPKLKINLLAGAVLGALAGLVIVFVMEWLESDVIRSSSDMEEHTHIAVLGVIPSTTTSSNRHRRR